MIQNIQYVMVYDIEYMIYGIYDMVFRALYPICVLLLRIEILHLWQWLLY